MDMDDCLSMSMSCFALNPVSTQQSFRFSFRVIFQSDKVVFVLNLHKYVKVCSPSFVSVWVYCPMSCITILVKELEAQTGLEPAGRLRRRQRWTIGTITPSPLMDTDAWKWREIRARRNRGRCHEYEDYLSDSKSWQSELSVRAAIESICVHVSCGCNNIQTRLPGEEVQCFYQMQIAKDAVNGLFIVTSRNVGCIFILFR